MQKSAIETGRAWRVAAFVGALSALAGLIALIVIRIVIGKPAYVSEMGAQGEPTAGFFAASLLLVALGGALGGIGCVGVNRFTRIFRWGSPAILLIGAGLSFGVASMVPCTQGCPAPGWSDFTAQDAVHITMAVLGFVLAGGAMIFSYLFSTIRVLRQVSLFSACAIAVIAGAGGILSLTRVATELGGVLEFIATGIGLLWLVLFGFILARGSLREIAR